ncbi:MAG: type II secretion system F family protein [Defluviitaleaceae bacterium]|nr:type II secretion system F family protein [Defluviitaleaceae bacterium]
MAIDPIITKPQGENTEPVSIWHRDITMLFKTGYTPQAPLREIAIFSRKLSFLLSAGIPIKSALSIVSEELTGWGLRNLLPKLNTRVQQGESLSAAIKSTGAFPAFFYGFVQIGESTARLPQVMEQLAEFYDQQAQTKEELTAAMVYPIAVTIMMLGVIVLAVTFVLPGYSRIFDTTGVPLPAITRGLLHISNFVITNGRLITIYLAAIIVLTTFFLRSKNGRWLIAGLALKVPLIKQGVNFRFTQALYLLLSAGLPVSQALPFIEDVMDNVRVKSSIGTITAQIKMGRPFWAALSDVQFIDPLLTGLARVGEETGHMPQTMEKCQVYYSQQYKQAIKRLSKLIEPIITLLLGVGLGIIMLAIILPTFELATVL